MFREKKYPELWLVLGLLTLIFTFLFGFLIFNAELISSAGDLKSNFWPLYTYLKTSFDHGQIAFWYPIKDSGIPIYGNYSYGLGYPLYWLYFFLPVSQVSSLIIYFSLIATGFFSYLLARKSFNLSFQTSLFYTVVASLTPKVFAHIYAGHITLIASLPYISLTIFAYINLFKNPSAKSSLLLAVSISLMYLTGGAQTPFYTLFALVLLSVGYIFQLLWNRRLKINFLILKSRLVYLTLAVALTLGLSAFQLIPSLNHLANSPRSRLTYWETAIPGLYSDSLLTALNPWPLQLPHHETIFYLGIFPLLLLPLGLFFKSPLKLSILLVAAFAFFFAFGANLSPSLHRFFFTYVPGFQYWRVPPRILFIFLPFALLLAAFGLEFVRHKLGQKKKSLMTIFGLVILIITFFDLYPYDQRYLKPIPSPAQDQQILETARFLENYFDQTNPPNRIFTLNRSMPEASVLLAGGQAADGLEDMFINDYVNFMKIANNYSLAEYSSTIPPYQLFEKDDQGQPQLRPNPKLLGLLNIKYIFSPYSIDDEQLSLAGIYQNLYIYENKALLPRAFLAFNTSPSQQITDLKNIDPSETVLLEEDGFQIKNEGKKIKPAVIINYNTNTINVRTVSDQQAYLVLGEVFYPGWQVYLDGQKTSIVKANHLLRAVLVPPGNHIVEFKLEPPYSLTYLLITLFTLLVSAIILTKDKLLSRSR